MFLWKFFRNNIIVLFIGMGLFFIPFFWFSPGAIDIGGDGTRLYLYDPSSFIKNVASSSIATDGKGSVDPTKFAYLGSVLFIELLTKIFHSVSTVTYIFGGLKLSIGFISVYFIVKEFISYGESKKKKLLAAELPAIISGIFYVAATGSEKLIVYWVKPIISHDQVFLNPLIFLLLLRYFLTKNRWYMLGVLAVTLVFSSSFAMIASPPFFAFYPLTLVFLFLYVLKVRKVKVSLSEILLPALFFLGLHAFHLVPEFASVFAKNTLSTSVVFKESGVNYFNAIRGLGVAMVNLSIPSPEPSLRWLSFVPPIVIVAGFIEQGKKRKDLMLTCVFFCITFFLVTANITHLGVSVYQMFFRIPGFAMFRNFYLQWAYVFIFFYALLFGLSLSIVFRNMYTKYKIFISIIILTLFLIGFWPFLSGKSVDGIHWGSNQVKTAMVMDPKYEDAMKFIKNLPKEGKMLVLPLTDNYNQVLFGVNNAAYVGPSTIPYLTGKQSFAGYQNFWPDPIPEEIMRYAREKNYEALLQIFSIFNIRYVFHNTDTKIYEEKFPQFPNSYMMTSLPRTQSEYRDFVQKFPVSSIYKDGPYEIYELDSDVYRSEVYIPDVIYEGDMLQLIDQGNISFHSAFLDQETCLSDDDIRLLCETYTPSDVSIVTQKINQTEYIIHVKHHSDDVPYILIFQNSFHSDWKLTINKSRPLSDEKHIIANKYANAWIISPEDHDGKKEYDMHIILETQRYFRYGVWITWACIGIASVFIIYSLFKNRHYEKN